MTDTQEAQFWFLANAYASSTLDTPKRKADLLKFVEDLVKAGPTKKQAEPRSNRSTKQKQD